MFLRDTLSNYLGYKMPGNFTAVGLEPVSILGSGPMAGATRFTGYGMNFDYLKGSGFAFSPTPAAAATTGRGLFTMAGIKARMPGNPWGLGLGALMVYSGFQEGGLSGAYDALALNVAVEASLFKWGYGVGNALQSPRNKWLANNTKLAGHPLKIGTGSAIFRGLGASVGGFLGQQAGLATGVPMAGTIGATLGAYVGAAPLRALGSHPIVGGVLAAGATAAVASYGAYSIIKSFGEMGYQRRQMTRGVNTDGNMAAFMTQNALTMRGRSVEAIAKSHMNARSALGQEASFMHSPRNYNSRYR